MTIRRIAFDVTPEVVGRTGVARYCRELGAALEVRDDCELVRFAFGRRLHAVSAGTRHVRVPLRAVQGAWRLLGVPRAEVLTGPVDVVHSLDLIPPPTRSPLVATVHDVAALELPSLHDRRRVETQRRQLDAVARATVVLTVSRSMAARLAAYGIEPDRVHVAPNGLTPLPSPADPPLPPGPFILTVGTLEPRKAHDVLLRAAGNGGALRGNRLVFAGPTAGREDALRSLARDLGIGDRLTILGSVHDAVLAGLYRDAALLCMPSLAEGFGLPILEALSFGLPVVASDLDVVHEVAGEHAVVFPRGDSGALAEALASTLDDTALREGMRLNGPARAAMFTWDATAREAVAAYDRAIGQATADAGEPRSAWSRHC